MRGGMSILECGFQSCSRANACLEQPKMTSSFLFFVFVFVCLFSWVFFCFVFCWVEMSAYC